EVARLGVFLKLRHGAVLDIAGHGGGPGGDGGDDADGRGGGVDEVGELGAGDVVLVRYGAHDAAHGQAVEVVVHEDEHTERDGGQLRADAGLDVLCRPAPEGRGAARAVHERDHRAEDDEEDEDADEEGGVDLIRDEREDDGYDGRQQRPGRAVKAAYGLLRLAAVREHAQDERADDERQDGDERRQGADFFSLVHFFSRSLL